MLPTSIPRARVDAARAARHRIDTLTKPLGSLGRIEELAERLAAIGASSPEHRFERRVVLIAAGDHGVTAEGVSAYPAEVTPQMVAAILNGYAAINAFARTARAEVLVADFGVASEIAPHDRLLDLNIGRGTRNFAREPAMDDAQVSRALAAGAEAIDRTRERFDPQIIAFGEMGIGNTSSATAILCALTGEEVTRMVGRGTGIDDLGLRRKVAAIEAGLARCGDGSDWRRVAREVGGFEIVGMAGAILETARRALPILLDGFIVASAAVLAARIDPAVLDYCIASHRSREPGHDLALRSMGLAPLLDLDLRLGEGSGAALAFPLVEAAARMYFEMKTFEEAGVATQSEVAAKA